jgi:pyruvate kinase
MVEHRETPSHTSSRNHDTHLTMLDNVKKNKDVNQTGMELHLPTLSEKRHEGFEGSCEIGGDCIANSFMRIGANVHSVIAFLNR